MARARSIPCVGLPVLVVTVLALAIGSQAAAAAKQSARSTRIPYTLTVDFTGKHSDKHYDNNLQNPGTPSSRCCVGSNATSEVVTTYRARSRELGKPTRPFYIYRSPRRSQPPRFYFSTPVTGEFTHRGSGRSSAWEPRSQNEQVYTFYCGSSWTDTVYPDKTLVTGWVDLRPWGTQRITIDIAPAADENGEWIGVRKEFSDCPGTLSASQYEFKSSQLALPPRTPVTGTKQRTKTVDLRDKFGDAFEIPYKPTATYEDLSGNLFQASRTSAYSWTLRFTPTGKRKRR